MKSLVQKSVVSVERSSPQAGDVSVIDQKQY